MLYNNDTTRWSLVKHWSYVLYWIIVHSMDRLYVIDKPCNFCLNLMDDRNLNYAQIWNYSDSNYNEMVFAKPFATCNSIITRYTSYCSCFAASIRGVQILKSFTLTWKVLLLLLLSINLCFESYFMVISNQTQQQRPLLKLGHVYYWLIKSS